MPPSFTNLSMTLNYPQYYLFYREEKPPPGELQYCGPHFVAVISYAVKLASGETPATFSEGLTSLDDAARGCRYYISLTGPKKILGLLTSFLTEIREFFIFPKLNQCPLDTTAFKTADLVTRFIGFLVNTFVILTSRHTPSWIIVPDQINILCKRLKVLLFILLDTPFWCTEMESIKNILGEIKSVANEAGIFLYSFFFTTDHITMTTMDRELSRLSTKLDFMEGMMKQHVVTIFEQKKSTTLNFTSASIFIVDSFLDDLNHVLNHKADLIVEVKDEITTLHKELCLSRSMLKDLELLQNKESIECEMQLINLAYQAEPIIACLAAGDVPGWYLALSLPRSIQKNKTIRAKLENIKLNSGIQGIRGEESSSELSSSRIVTKSIPMVGETLVGFEKIKRQIVSQLIGETHEPLQIISIVGMGGLGKTTLARKLFNHSRVRLWFDKCSWCVVSQTYQRRPLLIEILSYVSALNKDRILEMEDHQLVDHLHKSLKGTRYLIVIDDIWEKEVWDDLRRYFPNDRNGSKILFTTRNKEVALHASSEPFIHDLPLLTVDECWDLLKTKVFPNSDLSLELEDVGKKIAKNCKGLPLAVVGMAGVLSTMEMKEVLWKKVATHLSSYVSEGRDILELSYKHLPSHLKPCFLDLGTFEEDEKIRVRYLLSLWISKGFIQRIEHKSPEDVAEDYLLELINRSMIQPAETRSDGGVKTCTIHDLMRDMSLRLADKEKFFKVINEEYSIHEEHHDIQIHSGSNYFMSRPLRPHIRALSGNFRDLSSITSSMIRLKVLKLANPDIEYDGTVLELLLQLRHLECVGNLRKFGSHMKLEFLSLGKSQEVRLELNMPQLKHLHFSEYQRIPKAWYDSLPNGLQTLSRIIINDLDDEMRLRRFSNLRRLKCLYGDSWFGCPDSVNLSSLSQLVSLHVEGWLRKDFKTFDCPVNIRKLSISMMGLTREVFLSIGRLPNLEILKMEHILLREMRWDVRDDLFMKLKFLKLKSIFGCKEWTTSENPFPSLEQLLLEVNNKLCPIPSELGNIPTLQKIEVYRCSYAVKRSARKIKEEQEEYGNEQLKVIIHSLPSRKPVCKRRRM